MKITSQYNDEVLQLLLHPTSDQLDFLYHYLEMYKKYKFGI